MEPMYWLIAVSVFLGLEIITQGLTTIWFAGGSLAAFVAANLGAPLWVQLVLFFAVSIVLLIFTRPIAERYFNRSRTQTNVDSLIGRQGRAIEEINNFNQTGKIMLNGMEWMARSSEENRVIPAGTKVEVENVVGAHVVVREWEKEKGGNEE